LDQVYPSGRHTNWHQTGQIRRKKGANQRLFMIIAATTAA